MGLRESIEFIEMAQDSKQVVDKRRTPYESVLKSIPRRIKFPGHTRCESISI